jgi:hypothetical protein
MLKRDSENLSRREACPMYPIVFNKSRAQELLTIVGEGKDIPAPPGGWNCDQMLQVAGTLLFAAMSHGPAALDKYDAGSNTNGDVSTQTLADDLHMAIDFYSDLTMMVCGDTYDDRFEPELTAVVMRDGADRGFKIIRGGKHGDG